MAAPKRLAGPTATAGRKRGLSAPSALLVGSGDTVAVAYERTLRGLPVFGGDFAVVTDDAGHVLNTSVAQTQPIKVASLEPSGAPADAVSAAGTRFDSVDATGAPEKIVYALGAEPRQARFFVDRGRRRNHLVPAMRRMNVDLDDAGIRRHFDDVEARIGWRPITFEMNRHQ